MSEVKIGDTLSFETTVTVGVLSRVMCLHADLLRFSVHVCACVVTERGLAEQVVESGILPVLAQALRRKSSLTVHTARLVAELAREGEWSTVLIYV